MEGHLNLIKTEFKEEEKRVFPRFPFSYLTFKGEEEATPTFEVKDISLSGMQLCLKDGGHSYTPGKKISGSLHWKGACLESSGEVQWVSGSRLGVSFSLENDFSSKIKNFLSIENIIAGMRPIHSSNLGLELPADLKYWLSADGPVELFMWRHNDGEISRFQMILFDSFVEWYDGVGLKSGRVLTKRDLDTPLVTEDEFVFQIDETVDPEKLHFAGEIIQHIDQNFLPGEAIDFLKRKLGLSTEN